MPRHCLSVLLNFVKSCPVMRKPTASARPMTVLLELSTSADPWKFAFLSLQLLHTNKIFMEPPRPVDSTLAATSMLKGKEIGVICGTYKGKVNILVYLPLALQTERQKYKRKNTMRNTHELF